MSKAEEAALKAYPKPFLERITTDVYAEPREFFQEGYEQAKKDILEWLDVKYAEVRQLCDYTDDAVY